MKTYILYLIALFFSSVVFCQNKKIEILWQDNELVSVGQNSLLLPYASDFGITENDKGELVFSKNWIQDNNSYVGSVVSNVIYEQVDSSLVKELNKIPIPNQLIPEVFISKGRDVIYETLFFPPFVKASEGYKRVKSFELISVSRYNVNLNSFSAKSLKSTATSSSVLASGDWFKFKVDTTGIYKITPQFLSSLGMNISTENANTIKIYGNGGKSLPLANDDNLFFDVPEVPVKLVGGEDGVFDGADYMLFYAIGTQGYVADNDSHINPYDDNSYYYVTSGGNVGKKISTMIEPSGIVSQVFEAYDYYCFYEQDENNLGHYGRKWFGEELGGAKSEKNIAFELPELVDGGTVVANATYASVYSSIPRVDFKILNGSNVLSSVSANLSLYNQDSFVYPSSFSSTFLTTSVSSDLVSGNLNLSLAFDGGADIESACYLDYFSVTALCNLKGIGSQFGFSNSLTESLVGVGQFKLSNAKDVFAVWNVTNPYDVSEKLNNQSDEFSINFQGGSSFDFVALDENDFYEPIKLTNSRVANQDLKGNVFLNNSGQFEDVDYLIITSSAFLSAANRLANFRAKNDGFNAKVVDVNSIYTEFSTGKQDVAAIRNFIKYIYDNGTDDSRLKYVCVLSDGSYDYKNRISNNENYVPLYHSKESSSVTSSYATDDFYTLMDTGEGDNINIEKMDISIGRMLAQNLAEANTAVDKVIDYYSEEAYGDWRNSMLFVSDDVGLTSDGELQEVIVEISNKIEEEFGRVNVKRILMDSYVQEVTSGGQRYPEAKQDLLDSFQQGVSYINYFGHGGEDGISGEFIFTSETAKELTNEGRLPVFITLTCELTRFDNPNRETAGEYLYKNSIGGAVALLSTTRQLFLSVGTNLNRYFADVLFDESNLVQSIGDITMLAKNEVSNVNARVVFCIGDPALKMSIPKPEVVLTEVNGNLIEDWMSSGQTLRALDRVNLVGKVVDGVSNEDLSSYSGKVIISIFDKDLEVTTLANDGTENENGELIKIDFTEIGGIVFKGVASVKNGKFTMDFVLPKNVKLPEGEGKVSFYVQKDSELDDQSGSQKIIIGGLNSEAPEDVQPPIINLFLNDETFYSGQLVGSSPSIFVKFSDENGINTASGVGHDIVAVLDGDELNPIVLNEYYETALDDYTNGQLTYKLNNLSEGEHVLELRASDTYNNSSVSEVSFVVGNSSIFSITNVLNYPNPFVSYTEFWFSHTGLENDSLEVSLQVMTVTGKVVTSKFTTLSGKNTYRAAITWDGKDDFGNKIGKGVYVYKITVKSTLTNKTTSEFQKLVKL